MYDGFAGYRNQTVHDPKAKSSPDAFNYLIYSGRQVIRPDQLSEMDTTQIAIPFAPQEQGKPETTQNNRDVLKTLSVKKTRPVPISFWALRTSLRVHYAMPHPQHALRRAAI